MSTVTQQNLCALQTILGNFSHPLHGEMFCVTQRNVLHYTAKCSVLHGEMLCVTRRNVLRYMTEMEYFANFTKYLSKTRSKLNSRDPNQKKLNQMYFPQNLHYVRFTAKKAWNMKEFEVACRNSDQIYLHKQSRSRSKTNY